MSKKKEEPYFVEVDQTDCQQCGAGATYTIVGPDTYALGMTWTKEAFEEGTVDKICEWLNDAYYLGQDSIRSKKRRKV